MTATPRPWVTLRPYEVGSTFTVHIMTDTDGHIGEMRSVGMLSCRLPADPAKADERRRQLVADAELIIRACNAGVPV